MPCRVRNTELPPGTRLKWQPVVDTLAVWLEVSTALITRLDPPLLEVLVTSQTLDNPYRQRELVPLHQHYCAKVVESCQPLLLRESLQEANGQWVEQNKSGLVAYWGYPLLWPGREVFGTLCVLHHEEIAFSQASRLLMEQAKAVIEGHLALLDRSLAISSLDFQLANARRQVQELQRLLPLCPSCHRPRQDDQYWQEVEHYLDQHHEALAGAGLCPRCAQKRQLPLWDNQFLPLEG